MRKKVVDLRSDTVTLPTDEMRSAMFTAKLGDDVFSEDPNVNLLEKRVAEMIGTEAALLVVSGTMGNQVSVLTHCRRGEEAILGDVSHIFINEAGAMSAHGGVHPRTVQNQPDGTIDLDDIRKAVRKEDVHYPRTRLICLENTHNRCFGSPLSVDYTRSVVKEAKQRNLKIHLDGARIFNAAVALDVDVKELAAGFDSINICFSKGLAAPVGSIVCGSEKFISEARRTRKMLGGGMRQAGIIAAPCLVAVEKMIGRLEEDHQNAKLLAEGISSIQGLEIDLDLVHTNLVYFNIKHPTMDASDFVRRAADRDVLILATGQDQFRAVTHHGITSEDIQIAVDNFHEIMLL